MAERTFGNYVVERALGAGSFATVWLGYDPLLDTHVAIKVLAENWSQNDDVRRRFIEEAKILRQISHDGVVRVHLIDEVDDGRPYFVMEWADRGSLVERITAGEPQNPIDVVRSTIEILECLVVVHDFGVVHRDMKPSNVLFRSLRSHERAADERAGRPARIERAVLGDFGLAKNVVAASGFTLAAGTPAYMAPEQSRSSSTIDARADLYSVGVMLFEMLAGRSPFPTETMSDIRAGRRLTSTPALGELRPELPADLLAIVDQAMSIDPTERHADAVAMLIDLRAVLTRLGSIPAQPDPASDLGSDLPAVHPLTRRVLAAIARLGELAADPAWTTALDDATVIALADDAPAGALDANPDTTADAAIAHIRRAIAGAEGHALDADRRVRAEEILDQLDRDVPELVERRLATSLRTGEVRLAGPLAEEAIRILTPGDPWARLRPLREDGSIDLGDPAVLNDEVTRLLDRWRGLSNSGRIPFTARPVAHGVITALERLWLDTRA